MSRWSWYTLEVIEWTKAGEADLNKKGEIARWAAGEAKPVDVKAVPEGWW